MTYRSGPFTVRIYAILLNFYPTDFRHKYGDEMLSIFEESCRDAASQSDITGVASLCLMTFLDLVKTAIAERMLRFTKLEMERGVSVGASLLIHLAALWGLTWVAVHPPLSLGDGCRKEQFMAASSVHQKVAPIASPTLFPNVPRPRLQIP
jgi:hypothetical protein